MPFALAFSIALSLVTTCGCGRLAVPAAPGLPAWGRPSLTLPAAASVLPGRALPGDTGPDLSGPEARVAIIGVFVAAPGAGADFIGSGAGEGVAFAYRARGGGDPDGDVYLEWGLERSSHEEAGSGLAAEYWRATGGMRWSFAWGNRTELFLSFGAGYHGIEVSGGRELAGPGAYGGAGVEFLLGRAFSALLSVKLNYLWGDDPGYAAVLAAGIGLRF